MKIAITENHCIKGLKRSYRYDTVAMAIADAFKQRFKQTVKVFVTNADQAFINGCRVVLPDNVKDFIRAADTNQTVHPMTFEIPNPPVGFFDRSE